MPRGLWIEQRCIELAIALGKIGPTIGSYAAAARGMALELGEHLDYLSRWKNIEDAGKLLEDEGVGQPGEFDGNEEEDDDA
jgi:hypothetical protein